MRILHINDYCYPLGGAETYLAALIAQQIQSGHDTRYLTSNSRGGGTLAVYEGGPCFHDSPHYLANGTSSSRKPVRALYQLVNLSAHKVASEVASRFRPDVVHVHLYLGQLSPAVLRPFVDAGIPLVHTSHNYRIACPKGDRSLSGMTFCTKNTGWPCIKYCSAVSFFHMRMRERIHPRPQAIFRRVIAPSTAMEKILRLEGFTDVLLLPYGSTFGRREFVEERYRSHNILFVGRFSSNKGIMNLIRAFSRVVGSFPQAHLVLAGDGPEKKDAEQLAARILPDGSCTFQGMVTPDEIKTLQDGSRMQCVPSTWPDNSPLVVYESLNSGIPLVASDVGGIPDLVRNNQDAVLVAPGNEDELAQALLRLLTDDEEIMRLSRSAHQRAREFDMHQHATALEKVYQSVIR